jgi:hypothetical protein
MVMRKNVAAERRGDLSGFGIGTNGWRKCRINATKIPRMASFWVTRLVQSTTLDRRVAPGRHLDASPPVGPGAVAWSKSADARARRLPGDEIGDQFQLGPELVQHLVGNESNQNRSDVSGV